MRASNRANARDEKSAPLANSAPSQDRAGERRKRHAPEAGSVAVDALINKFDHIVQGEKALAPKS